MASKSESGERRNSVREMGKLAVQKTVKKSAVAAKPTGERAGFLSRVGKFLREVRMELAKVSWPNRQEVVASTVVVLVAVAFFALFIGGIDLVFVKVIQALSSIRG